MRELVQLALDFFVPAAQEPTVRDLGEAGNIKQKWPLSPGHKALEAPYFIADSTEEPPAADSPLAVAAHSTAASATWPGPVVFRHPQARRELRLGNALVGYALARARRRTIGFTVGAEGLAVRAPHSVSLSAIDAALAEKATWILRKLDETRARAARQDEARIVWRDGVEFPYLGAVLRVHLVPDAPVSGLYQPGNGDAPAQLQLGLPMRSGVEPLRDATAAWLGRRARQHFSERLNHFAPRMGVRWQRLALTNARTRWGSARSDGTIRLNWRLMHFAPEVLDYVVVHELAHLRFMDHSARFWATVESELPDYRVLRARLQAEAAPVWRDE